MSGEAKSNQVFEQDWKFIKDLKSKLHKNVSLSRKRKRSGEVSLADGVKLDPRFPDEDKVLEASYNDFKWFLNAAGIKRGGGFRISTGKADTDSFESYRIEVDEKSCSILANDAEGIRRGLIFVEDEIQRAGGPFLMKGCVERRAVIKTRISRCFFGPIKRPPMNRDELADNIDYYPDEYLNRLAHEGVNGLWLTAQFSDLCPSRFFPGHGKDAKKRIDKLNKTVEKCREYGIKIYVFCIEPRGFGPWPEHLLPEDALKNNDYFAGHVGQDGHLKGLTYFCTSSEEGLEYLEECTHHLFSAVPGLGGLIDINLGERPTHCYSSLTNFFDNNCPRCSKRKPWEVFADTSGALAAGMQKANPGAEMISWLYVPSIPGKTPGKVKEIEDVLKKIAAHTPENVILQYNFESNGRAVQLGRERQLLDYWLAWPGPCEIFRGCAENAVKNGARSSAKIQVGCSHEVATVPFVPVPGNLYKKYSAMHDLKVSSVMQCWYFGNYPGLMNKAAGELSFSPFPDTEEEFLLSLAKIYWARNAEKVVKAWKYFQAGYSSFPFNLSFTWYGPVHHSVVWPLYLRPVDKPISPSWKFTFPIESGDRIGECLCYDHTLEETLVLLEKMSGNWRRGTEIFKGIEPEYTDNPERALDIILAEALNIQISSAYNIFQFYALREKLPYLGISGGKKTLNKMKSIAKEEIENSLSLAKLCLKDSRLGFHSEAEGYKYNPQKLKRRAELIKKMLSKEFPEVERGIEGGAGLFPEYTGAKSEGPSYDCAGKEDSSRWEEFPSRAARWKSWRDEKNIYFRIECSGENETSEDTVVLKIEPRRLWPAQSFTVSKNGFMRHDNFKTTGDSSWTAKVEQRRGGWEAFISIPFEIFKGYHTEGRPMRINVIRGDSSWIKLHPWEHRLRFLSDNPADLGWLFFV